MRTIRAGSQPQASSASSALLKESAVHDACGGVALASSPLHPARAHLRSVIADTWTRRSGAAHRLA